MLYLGDEIIFYTIVDKDDVTFINEHGLFLEQYKTMHGTFEPHKLFLFKTIDIAKQMISEINDSKEFNDNYSIIKIDSSKINDIFKFEISCFSQNGNILWTYSNIPPGGISEIQYIYFDNKK